MNYAAEEGAEPPPPGRGGSLCVCAHACARAAMSSVCVCMYVCVSPCITNGKQLIKNKKEEEERKRNNKYNGKLDVAPPNINYLIKTRTEENC